MQCKNSYKNYPIKLSLLVCRSGIAKKPIIYFMKTEDQNIMTHGEDAGTLLSELSELAILTFAEGAVDPAIRIDSGEISGHKVLEVVDRLRGDEFYADIPAGQIPCKCMDCRRRIDGVVELGSNAAGGTVTMIVADALTHNSYRLKGEDFAAHSRRVATVLKDKELPIGIHDADTADDHSCGCGAIDKLDSDDPFRPSILSFIVRKGNEIRTIVESIGFPVDDEVHAMITTNAESLIASKYGVMGYRAKQAIVEVAEVGCVETLVGKQLAVAAVVNTKDGKTLNREKLAAEFGDDYQAFNIDVPGIIEGARATSISEPEAQEKTVAALYYNFAAAGVIAAPSMPVVVR